MLIRHLLPFFYPDEGGPSEITNLSADLAVLNDEGTEGTEPESEEDREKKEIEDDVKILSLEEEGEGEIPPMEGDDGEEDDEEKDSEETDQDKEDEESRVLEVSGRPTVKQIKAVAPDLFKKIPEMKNIFFREGQFSEIFSTPEEAREAAVFSNNYLRLERSLAGDKDPSLLIKELKENNPEALKKINSSWLSKIREADQNLYIEATTPVIEELLYHAFTYARKTNDKNLAASAQHIANYVFANGGEIPDIRLRAENEEKKHPAEIQLEKERRAFANHSFTQADQEVSGRIMKTLEASIIQGLDVNNRLSDRQKRNIIRDVIEELDKTLLTDKTHSRRMTVVWDRGRTDSFSKQSKDSIVNTYLSGAKPLLKTIRQRVLSETFGKRKQEPQTEERTQEKRSFAGSRRPADFRRTAGQVLDPSKIDYRRTSDMDILMDRGGDKIKLKGQR